MVSRDAAWEERRERFGKLVGAEFYARLWRQAAWLTSSREDADDLLQDTLARAYQRLHQLRDDSRFYPWLLGIMRRGFLNLQRGRQRRHAHEGQWRSEAELRWLQLQTDHVEGGPQNPGPESVLALDALLRLKPDERWLLTVHYIEDVKTRELAAALKLGEPAIRQRLSRARHALKREMERLQAADGK